MRLGGLTAQLREVGAPRVHFDLSFDFHVLGSGIECSFTYARDLIDEEVVVQLARAYSDWAAQLVSDPRRPLTDLEFPERDERVGAGLERPFASSILDAWFRSVDRYPNTHSLFVNGTGVDYRTLDTRSSVLAQRLVERGVAVGSVVCLHADRTEGFVIGVLAVLKAGGAYVPLDPQLPAQRLAYQLKDSGCASAAEYHGGRVGR